MSTSKDRIKDQINASSFLNDAQKEYFLLKLATLTEQGMVEIEQFLQNANQRYREEEKRIEQKYSEELQQISNEVDRDFITAKKLIESSMAKQDRVEEEALLKQL